MATSSPFAAAQHYQPAEKTEYRGAWLPAFFRDVGDEYETARTHVAVFDRSDRGLVIASGGDRKVWLHNLVTNAVKTLEDGTGNYAFAVNVKGRVLFDLNVLSLPEALWLDIDARTVPAALGHLEHYLITEDARLADAREQYARLGCAGPQATEIADRLGIMDFSARPALSSCELSEGAARFIRHDSVGLPGFELVVTRETAAAWWDRFVGELAVQPAGFHALDTLRIEAGIPWYGRDIDEHVLPPETGQVERGISYQKGCYLGQEVIERMRSHGALARRLVRLSTNDGAGLELPAALRTGDADVGRITSLVKHPRTPQWIGLGYLKTSVRDPVGLSAGDPQRAIHVETR